ncbi:MAG: hypothetical protein MJE77_33870 [Proteobacteria bacterium]|nr:hypothetical protein [Pseudomonadota bacterium]
MPERLGEIVIESGLAARDVVLRAAQHAEQEGMPLVAVLVHEEGVDELALVAAIKRHVRVSIEDPAQVEHDSEAMRQISRDDCWRLRVMPLALIVYDTGTRFLRLAMADPTDAVTIAEVEHVTGCQVDGVLMPLSAVEELVDKAYRAYVTEVIPRERAALVPGPRGESLVRELERDSKATESALSSSGEVKSVPSESTSPTTVPYHRVTDEASLEIRHRALLDVLLQKRVFSEDEYQEQVRLLMRQHSDKA